ncbi:L-idonate 5-dehydrogenase [Ruegeria sp. HKCCD6604]|uniref:L-idonate 5-dehydrogenase n=1 Tax=Ruegeria sp. HKCCD6604 TaxID=2683000 RepID=UPI001492A80C|nr:L-idonate 5-dehydrogenase [Ruegeria sp. HKCCD6604]NOC91174.1 alcohol dehydrogenase catalytic domain-containing protein [Ruegeria sp. HKCCD6604]
MSSASVAVVIHAAKDLRLENRDVRDLGQDEVLIALRVGGICGSDLHYYNHGGFGAIKLLQPMVLGHEVAGEIVEFGSSVQGLNLGQLVAVSPSRPCQACYYCLNGQQNHCLDMKFYGSAMPFPHIQGAFRSKLVAKASQCVPADGLSPAQAAMAEPLAVCLHAVKQAGSLVGKTVLITGCGPIGCLTTLVARRSGAARIVATDISDQTLAIARECGADDVINTYTDPQMLERFEKDKGQIDVQLECSGAQSALASGVECLRPRGTLVQLGLGGDMTVPMQALTAKEIELRGSFRFHSEFAVAVEMMRSGLLNVDHLVTHSFEVGEAVTAFEVASDRSRSMKVQLTFPDNDNG